MQDLKTLKDLQSSSGKNRQSWKRELAFIVALVLHCNSIIFKFSPKVSTKGAYFPGIQKLQPTASYWM